MQKKNISQYVIQQHWHRDKGTHYDLMLQCGEILKTWRIMQSPAQIVKKPVKAEKIFDHPLKFLDYEGPVNKGLGKVKIVESGTYELIKSTDSILKLNFTGTHLRGMYTLTLDRPQDSGWTLAVAKKQ